MRHVFPLISGKARATHGDKTHGNTPITATLASFPHHLLLFSPHNPLHCLLKHLQPLISFLLRHNKGRGKPYHGLPAAQEHDALFVAFPDDPVSGCGVGGFVGFDDFGADHEAEAPNVAYAGVGVLEFPEALLDMGAEGLGVGSWFFYFHEFEGCKGNGRFPGFPGKFQGRFGKKVRRKWKKRAFFPPFPNARLIRKC